MCTRNTDRYTHMVSQKVVICITETGLCFLSFPGSVDFKRLSVSSPVFKTVFNFSLHKVFQPFFNFSLHKVFQPFFNFSLHKVFQPIILFVLDIIIHFILQFCLSLLLPKNACIILCLVWL